MDQYSMKIRPISINFDATIGAKISYDTIFHDETKNYSATLEIYENGKYGTIVYTTQSNDGGPWTIPPNALENGKIYQMRSRLTLEANMWSDFIRFHCEKHGIITFISPENGVPTTTVTCQKNRIDLKVFWEQVNNDIPEKIKYEFFKGSTSIDTATSKVESEWLYLKNSYPTLGGRVIVKSVPIAGTYTVTITKSNKTPISFPIVIETTDTVDSVAFKIAGSANVKAGLKFSLEGNLIQFGIREQLISVDFETTMGLNVECERLVLDLPTFFVHVPDGFSVPRATIISQKGIVTQKVGKAVRYDGLYEPLFGNIESFFYPQNGNVRISIEDLYRNNTITPIPDKIRIKRKRIDNDDVLLSYLNSLPKTIETSEVLNNQPEKSKDYVLYNKNFASISETSFMVDETKNTYLNVFSDIWEDVGEFNIVKIADDNLHFQNIFYGWDRTVVNGAKYLYSYEPLKNDGIGYASIQTVIPDPVTIDFEDDFIHDSSSFYRIRLNRKIGDISYNTNSQKFETLSGKYPIITTNQINYKTGNLSFDLVSEQSFMRSKVDIGSEKITNDAFMQFLTNKKPKLLRTKDGEILVIMVVGNPIIKYNEFIAGLATVTFEFVEICEPNFDNLYLYGLVYISSLDENLKKIYE